ncbi:HNH endonuclease [Lactococcus phage 57001]|uniref:HNH endonuclease n=1 Tax=Lactococcus phage 57001 TaxID=2029667 RepID=A0A343JPV2_9CAUD|nr:HNH endonuclease [Lactococcus phage 57001]ASZ71525.1 HNH endonuclease [Lactococcus phage 57001]
METINIKFDEKQLEEVVKKVTEKLKKEKDSDTAQEKVSVMYLEFNEANHASEKGKLYFGHAFHTLSKKYASEFYLSSESDLIKASELKSQGWKEEVIE